VYNGGSVDIIAIGADTIDDSNYSVSKNPSTGLHCRLHILTVGTSDVKKHRCSELDNGGIRTFYLQLILIGRCNYTLVIYMMWKIEGFIVVGESTFLFEVRPL
jgi:hypothetical protein